MVRRITRMTDGQAVATSAVILAYEDTLPKEVFINLRRFNISKYVPTPIRCNRCQRFGHKATQCEKPKIVCSRCSARGHDFVNCPTAQTEAKCANCGGNHNAAYRGCPKFKEVREILTVSAKKGMSYRDAALQLKKTTHEKQKADKTAATLSTTQQRSSSTTRQKVTAVIPATSVSTGTQTAETDSAASVSTLTGDDLTNDQILCLLNTTTTALLWLVKQIPAVTTGQEQIIQQLCIVMNVMKKWKNKTESKQATASTTKKPIQQQASSFGVDDSADAASINVHVEGNESGQFGRAMHA